MIDTFTAKVPVTYTERNIDGDNIIETTITIGHLFTSNVLASLAFQKEQAKEVLKK